MNEVQFGTSPRTKEKFVCRCAIGTAVPFGFWGCARRTEEMERCPTGQRPWQTPLLPAAPKRAALQAGTSGLSRDDVVAGRCRRLRCTQIDRLKRRQARKMTGARGALDMIVALNRTANHRCSRNRGRTQKCTRNYPAPISIGNGVFSQIWPILSFSTLKASRSCSIDAISARSSAEAF